MTANDSDAAVPADAGEHAEALARLLARIPRTSGRILSCGPGWYPILVRLDAAISAIDPDYVLEQVKEKYGTLRFYWDFSDLKPACCTERDRLDPRPASGPVSGPGVPPGRTDQEQAALDAWLARWENHHASKACEAGWAGLEPEFEARNERRELIDALVAAAEDESARTCEQCGQPGTLDTSRYWVRTLCPTCTAARD